MGNYKEYATHDWSDNSMRIIATPSPIAKSSFFYVQEIGHFHTQPQYFTERKGLNSYLIVYTLSGKGYLKYQNKSYVLLPNQAFFIDCSDYQFYKTDKDDLWEILWVHFNGGTSSGYYDYFKKCGNPIVTFDTSSNPMGIIYELIELHKEKKVDTELYSSQLLVNILTDFLVRTNQLNLSHPTTPEYIKSIMKYLDINFDDKISLDQLAKTFAISKYHLSREFKKYTGLTPNEYLINTRINYAKDLLKYSDLPVAAISEKVGIFNVSHFINLFKQYEEITPLIFKKNWNKPKP